MLKKIGYLLLATVVLTGCQKISDKELEVLNARAEKAEQLQQENALTKQKQASQVQSVEQLNEQLQQEIKNQQLVIEQNANTGIVKATLQQEILFPSNSYQIEQKGAMKMLETVVRSLDNTDGKAQLLIISHSDNIPVANK